MRATRAHGGRAHAAGRTTRGGSSVRRSVAWCARRSSTAAWPRTAAERPSRRSRSQCSWAAVCLVLPRPGARVRSALGRRADTAGTRRLALRMLVAARRPDPRGRLAHGYGEHIGRYDHVAALLGRRGGLRARPRRPRALRGERALITDFDLVVDDLHLLVEHARARTRAGRSCSSATRWAAWSPPATRSARRRARRGRALGAAGRQPPVDAPCSPRSAARGADRSRPALPRPGVGEATWPTRSSTTAASSARASPRSPRRARGGRSRSRSYRPAALAARRGRRARPARRPAPPDRAAGDADVTERTYPGARHEIFNETNRDEVLADTAGWIESVVGSAR